MQLTRFTDLGLRVLMYLTHRDREQSVTIAEIASQFSVPHNHLIKVVNRLGKLGLIDEVVKEPLGGAHRDPQLMAETLKASLLKHLGELTRQPITTLLDARGERLRSFGVFRE